MPTPPSVSAAISRNFGGPDFARGRLQQQIAREPRREEALSLCERELLD